MVGTRAALRYAKATLNLAKEKGFAKEVNDDMILIQSTIEENHDLEVMLKSPVIKAKAKKAVLTEIFEKNSTYVPELENTWVMLPLTVNTSSVDDLELTFSSKNTTIWIDQIEIENYK